MVDLLKSISQSEFGELVGISQPAVSGLLSRGIISTGAPAGEWLKGYCSHMREMAAGREASGDLDLATERALLAREQRVKIEMQNSVTRRELAPVTLIEEVLSKVGRQIAGILESIPVQLKRRSSLSLDDLEYIAAEIVKARNLAASIQLADLDIEISDDEVMVDVLPIRPSASNVNIGYNRAPLRVGFFICWYICWYL